MVKSLEYDNSICQACNVMNIISIEIKDIMNLEHPSPIAINLKHKSYKPVSSKHS